MNKFTNNTGISLSMAVFLATDLYDHNDDPNTISVTSLIKPIKQNILSARVPEIEMVSDLAGMVSPQTGTAVHTAIEWAWNNNYKSAMAELGYPQHVIDMVCINPTASQLTDYKLAGKEIIPVYMERRSQKLVEGFNVSGKFDFVIEEGVEDFKNTSTYTYINKSNDENYCLQGSIYRWLNQDIIKKDYITIQYIFKDWTAGGLRQNPKKYPPVAQLPYKVKLLSIPETDAYVRNRIIQIKTLWDAPEADMPECTSKELWRDAPVWKYYKNPTKTSGRSTKNFTNVHDANIRLGEDGGVGVVMEIKGKVKACAYCNAFSVCKQKENYLLDGSLKI